MERRARVLTSRPVYEDLDKMLNYPEVKDGWEKVFAGLVSEKGATEEALKDYLRECMDWDTRAPEMMDENDSQKFTFGQVANDVYDKLTESLNIDDFVNATAKSVNRFMAKDFLFYRSKLYCQKVDEEMYRKANEYTSHDMLTILLDRIYHRTVDKLHVLLKWRRNIDSYLLSNPVMDERFETPDQHPSMTSRSKNFFTICDRLKQQKLKVEVDIAKYQEEVSMLGKYLNDYKEIFKSIRGTFEKPNIDVSAKAKLIAKHDQVRLDKLLFNTQETKDVINGLSQNKIENYIIEEIVSRYKNSAIRTLNQNLKLSPNCIYTKLFTHTSSRMFTRYELSRQVIEAANTSQDRVYMLDNAPHMQKDEPLLKNLVNFQEYLISNTGQASNFIKLVSTGRKLTNLLISEDTLSIVINTIRLDEQKVSETFREILKIPAPIKYFSEAKNFPDFIFFLMEESLDYFDSKLFSASLRVSADWKENGTENGSTNTTLTPLKSILNDQSVLGCWFDVMKDAEKLELFNKTVEEVFNRLLEVQNNYLLFEDFYSRTKVLDISSIAVGIKFREKQAGTRGLLYSYLTLGERIKIKNAFWIKEGLLFKVTQKQPNEHYFTQLLKEQLKHPQIDNWLQLMLTHDSTALKYDMGRYVEDMLEMLNIKGDELKREKRTVNSTLTSYIKLLMLRGRTACLKLISYFNFGRSAQKSMNIRFLDLCEQGKVPEELMQSSTTKCYRKDDFLKLTRMFDQKDYEELRLIFDDETTASNPKEMFGFSNFEPKFSRLISNPEYKPYQSTNPSKGGFLGGVILGMDFDIQQEDYGVEYSDNETEKTNSKVPPENPFAEDLVSFVDLSETLDEKGVLKNCPFVDIKDANGNKIIYDASIHDFFDILNDLSLLISFFIENELSYYQDDPFEDLDLQFEDNQEGHTITQKNINTKVSKFNEFFNYEYLVTRILEFECQYQAEKTRLSKAIFDLADDVSDPRETVKLFDFLTDILSKRPHFDLNKYKYSNQNLVEWLQRVAIPRDPQTPNKAEILNLITSIFDNYRVETEYLRELANITQDLISEQKSIAERLENIMKTFEVFKSNPSKAKLEEEDLEELKPRVAVDFVLKVIKTIHTSGDILYTSFLNPSYLDKNTFSSYMFDFHYKRLIEEYLELPDNHKMDFLGNLNDFINGISGRYRFFIEQSVKKLVLGEARAQMIIHFEGADPGDDLAMFEGEVLPSPENCFSVLSTTYEFFRDQEKLNNMQGFDPEEGINIINKEAFLQQINRYFAYIMNIGMSMDIRETLLNLSHACLATKAYIDVIQPVYDGISKNAKFEKPEDMLDTPGNLIMKFMDFGDNCTYTLDDIRALLKIDPIKGMNSFNHFSRLKSMKDLLDHFCMYLTLTVQLNTLNDRLCESETFMHLSRILTTKESVFDHVYKFQLGKKSETPKYVLNELKQEFMRGEFSFKYFLWSYDMPYYDLISQYLMLSKKSCYFDPLKHAKEIVSKTTKMFGPVKSVHRDNEDTYTEGDIGLYFLENSLSKQETENSKIKGPTERKVPRRVSKVEIPSKDTKLQTVGITINSHPFIKQLLPLFRRHINYITLWLQNSRMVQTMNERTQFMSYNPTEVISYQREVDFGLSRLQQTIMKMLKFRGTSKHGEDDYEMVNDISSLFDEYGALKSIFRVLPIKLFKELIKRDHAYLYEKDLSPNEAKFYKEIEFIIFKQNSVLPAPKAGTKVKVDFEHANPTELKENTEILSKRSKKPDLTEKQAFRINDYAENYLRDIHAHLRKVKSEQINMINMVVNTNTNERITTGKVLGGMHKLNFSMNRETFGFGMHVGFEQNHSRIKGSSNKKFKFDRAARAAYYDEFFLEEIQETDLFVYFTQNSKLLAVLSLKLLIASLDLDENETVLLQKRILPFYTLNNLRLHELEDLLFHSSHAEPQPEEEAQPKSKQVRFEDSNERITDGKGPAVKGEVDVSQNIVEPNISSVSLNQTQQDKSAVGASDPDITNFEAPINLMEIKAPPQVSRGPKFAYRRLRNYLYAIKRIELKNRSNSRVIFDFIESVKTKMNDVLEDTKLTKPHTLFNTYLNCIFENEQRIFILSLLDTLSQLRWLENFNDLVDIHLDKIRKDNSLFFNVRSTLINLLFPKNSTFKVFYDLFTNKHLGEELTLPSQDYPFSSSSAPIAQQLTKVKALRNIVRKNNVLNLFESSFLSQTKYGTWADGLPSFNEFSYEENDSRWDQLFTQILSFKAPERTFISKKIFQIRLALDKDISMPSESIAPQNLWIYKILDSHRTLDLNVKNLLLLETLNSKIVNDLFCDRTKERSSVMVEESHLNDITFKKEHRQIIPSLLPFVSNSMFQRGEFYDFNRIVLRLWSTELHFTGSMYDVDQSLARFPDINFQSSYAAPIGNSEIELKLKKNIIVDSVWANNVVVPHPETLLEMKKAPSPYEIVDENPNKTLKIPKKPYSKDLYNKHKNSILRSMIEQLRESFFVRDLDSAYNYNYLILRELITQIVNEETARLRLIRVSLRQKNERTRQRDKLTVSLCRQALNTILASSYVLETTAGYDFIAIRKIDLNNVILSWNEQFIDTVQEELRKREMLYLIKLDDAHLEIESNVQNKEMIDFYFSHLMDVFKRVVSSKLVMRNMNFITELDTLARYCSFINRDSEMTLHKIISKINDHIDTYLENKNQENLQLAQSEKEAVEGIKEALRKSINFEREETMKKMKERTMELQADRNYPHPPAGTLVKYEVEIPLYEQEEYHAFVVKLNNQILLLKAFNGLKLQIKESKVRAKHKILEKKAEDKERYNFKLEELLRSEAKIKGDILALQMNISKLEIQNNLLRKEIHNAQFERIKLLKRTNEVKNSCHQLVWEGAKDKVDAKNITTLHYKKDELINSMDNQYLRSLFAEHNLFNHNFFKHPETVVATLPPENDKRLYSSAFRNRLIKKSLANDEKIMGIEFVSQNPEIQKISASMHLPRKLPSIELQKQNTGLLSQNMEENKAADPQSFSKKSKRLPALHKGEDQESSLYKEEKIDSISELPIERVAAERPGTVSRSSNLTDTRLQSAIPEKGRGLISATTQADSLGNKKALFFKAG